MTAILRREEVIRLQLIPAMLDVLAAGLRDIHDRYDVGEIEDDVAAAAAVAVEIAAFAEQASQTAEFLHNIATGSAGRGVPTDR